MATNYEKYFATPEKAAYIIYRLRYPRINNNYIPDDFELSWLDWKGKWDEEHEGEDYTLLGLLVEWLQEECDE